MALIYECKVLSNPWLAAHLASKERERKESPTGRHDVPRPTHSSETSSPVPSDFMGNLGAPWPDFRAMAQCVRETGAFKDRDTGNERAIESLRISVDTCSEEEWHTDEDDMEGEGEVQQAGVEGTTEGTEAGAKDGNVSTHTCVDKDGDQVMDGSDDTSAPAAPLETPQRKAPVLGGVPAPVAAAAVVGTESNDASGDVSAQGEDAAAEGGASTAQVEGGDEFMGRVMDALIDEYTQLRTKLLASHSREGKLRHHYQQLVHSKQLWEKYDFEKARLNPPYPSTTPAIHGGASQGSRPSRMVHPNPGFEKPCPMNISRPAHSASAAPTAPVLRMLQEAEHAAGSTLTRYAGEGGAFERGWYVCVRVL